MKTRHYVVLPRLIAVLNLIPAGCVTAQTFTTLHSFTAVPAPYYYTNSDGANPRAGLITNSSGTTLYGTAQGGGIGGYGTAFGVNTDGTGFTNLHSFTGGSGGYRLSGGLVLSGNTLFGTATYGGSSGNGTLFAVNTDGTGFTNLHSFTALPPPYYSTNSDGAYPLAGVLVSGNALYGTASAGGSSGGGVVFKLNTDGTDFATLHSFTATADSYPYIAGLVLSGNTLYGTAASGGSAGAGTVFAVNTDGTGFTNLHSFTALRTNVSGVYTNSDGAGPWAGLILSGNSLYGTAGGGGSSGVGTVFAVNTNGTGFTTLHAFSGSDGAFPQAGLILSGNALYGTTTYGASLGTVFAVNTNGTGFTTLYTFTEAFPSCCYPDPITGRFGCHCHVNSDGAFPQAGLILSGNTLYGTAGDGGSSGSGTVFSLSLPPLPPVARCKHVTVPGDASCSAGASIDDGSFSPNAGDTITLVQSPPGPYPLGDTSVTLTVTDSHGASNSCVATVTVVDTTPPAITCPGNIVTDATSPAGAVVSFAPAASDNCTLVSVTSTPASGSVFAIGDTTVSCTATDAAGSQAVCTFTVHVKGAAEQINNLIALVQRLGLQSGTANSLIVKLQGAANALDRGNIEAACGNLGAFLNEANAQKGKKLTAAQGDLLNAEATRIRTVLSCN